VEDGDSRAEFTLSPDGFFAEPVLSNTRSFPFTSFRVRMTGGEGLRMTGGEGLRMTGGEGLRMTEGEGLRMTEGEGLAMT